MFERLRGLLGLASGTTELRAAQIHRATDYGRDILVNSPDGWEHDRQWLWWVGDGSANGYGNPPPDARDVAGEALPAVMRCTSLIADTIAGMPWRVYRGFDMQPTPRFISDPQRTRPDGRAGGEMPPMPNAMSNVEFWANYLVSAMWFGDAYAWAPRGAVNGQVLDPLYLINPADVDYHDGQYWVGGVPLDMATVIHMRGEPPYSGGTGKGVLERFASDFALSSAMRAYAAGIFNTGIPSGYLKVNSPNITELQADTLKARWMAQHGGPKRSPAVLNAVTDFVPITISPVDSQLDTARTWSIRDIALAFGVPAYMLGVPGDSSTYANVESRMIEFRTFTLLPWIRRLEAVLDAQFPQGTEVKIVTDGLMRADTATRFTAYESALRAGWLTPDEVRALEDRPPLPEQVSTAPEDDMPPVVPDEPPAPEPTPEPSDTEAVPA